VRIGITNHSFVTTQMAVYFEDNGPGISPDRMADVFVNYGASTKRTSNEQTGGFGLGAKTPFSYTDSFYIITRYEGVEYTYVAAIEDGKKGKLYVLTKTETDKSNGTTVVIPIDEDDRMEFEEGIITATYFWDKPPEYENITLNETSLNISYNCDDFIIYDNSNNFRKYFGILIDGIYYSLDTQVLNKDHLLSYPGYQYVLFKFQTGQLTISANREALQYDNRTKYQINKKIKLFIDTCVKFGNQVLEESSTYIKKAILLNRLNGLSGKEDYRLDMLKYVIQTKAIKDLEYKHNGVPVCFSMQKDFSQLKFYLYTKTLGGTVSRQDMNFFNNQFNSYPIYFGDSPRVSTQRNRTIFKDNTSFIFIKPAHEFYYKWPEFSFSDRKKNAKAMRATLAQIDLLMSSGMTISLYSKLEKTRAPRGAIAAVPQEEGVKRYPVRAFYPLDTYREPHIYNTLKIEDGKFYVGGKEIDPKNAFYVTTSNLLSYDKNHPDAKLAGIINALKEEKEPSYLVVFVNQSKAKHIAGRIKSSEQFYKSLPLSTKKALVDLNIFADYSLKGDETLADICMENISVYENLKFESDIGKTVVKMWENIREKYGRKRRMANTLRYIDGTTKNKILNELKDYAEKSIVTEAQKVTVEFFSTFRLLRPLLKELRYTSKTKEMKDGLQEYVENREEILKIKGLLK